MGYDDIEPLRYISPRLTTIKYSVKKMGEIIFDTLFEVIKTQAKRSICLSMKLWKGKRLSEETVRFFIKKIVYAHDF